jgi:hypothetical protein
MAIVKIIKIHMHSDKLQSHELGEELIVAFFYITYINSVRTSQETQYISVVWPEL